MSERRTVKDLLADAKDHSELMVDLAHAAIFFGDDDIAAEVVRLRARPNVTPRRSPAASRTSLVTNTSPPLADSATRAATLTT